MTFTAATLAQELSDAELANWAPNGAVDQNCFINYVPTQPDLCVVITEFGGQRDRTFDGPGDAIATYQLRVRGGKQNDEIVDAREWLTQIIAYLEQSGHTTIGSGGAVFAAGSPYEGRVTYVLPQVPYLLAWDEQSRPEWAVRLVIRHD